MSTELIIGLVLITGFIFSEVVKILGFPKVTGYILAGIFLNPGLFGIIPVDFSENTDVLINIALSLITFSVGGTLRKNRIRKVGKSMLIITVFEAEGAFIMVAVGFFLFVGFVIKGSVTESLTAALAFSLLLGVFASPTDPSATFAVIGEYKARGKVATMIMGVAAFDDTIGILNFSIFTSITRSILGTGKSSLLHGILSPFWSIGGALILGILGGIILNMATKILKKETDGILIVVDRKSVV